VNVVARPAAAPVVRASAPLSPADVSAINAAASVVSSASASINASLAAPPGMQWPPPEEWQRWSAWASGIAQALQAAYSAALGAQAAASRVGATAGSGSGAWYAAQSVGSSLGPVPQLLSAVAAMLTPQGLSWVSPDGSRGQYPGAASYSSRGGNYVFYPNPQFVAAVRQVMTDLSGAVAYAQEAVKQAAYAAPAAPLSPPEVGVRQVETSEEGAEGGEEGRAPTAPPPGTEAAGAGARPPPAYGPQWPWPDYGSTGAWYAAGGAERVSLVARWPLGPTPTAALGQVDESQLSPGAQEGAEGASAAAGGGRPPSPYQPIPSQGADWTPQANPEWDWYRGRGYGGGGAARAVAPGRVVVAPTGFGQILTSGAGEGAEGGAESPEGTESAAGAAGKPPSSQPPPRYVPIPTQVPGPRGPASGPAARYPRAVLAREWAGVAAPASAAPQAYEPTAGAFFGALGGAAVGVVIGGLVEIEEVRHGKAFAAAAGAVAGALAGGVLGYVVNEQAIRASSASGGSAPSPPGYANV